MDYFIAAQDEIAIKDLPMAQMMGYIAIVIGASYQTKKLPVKKLKELCLQIDYPIILIGGKEDVVAANEIAQIDPIRIFNACGKYNLAGSADLVRKSKLVISHDTGLQYIACAFNKPVLAIWGATSPLLDVEPYYAKYGAAKYENFIVPALSCQPCSNFGTNKCPKGHFNCMEKQDIGAIANAVMKGLQLA